MPNRLRATLPFALLAAMALTACQPDGAATPATTGPAPASAAPSSTAPSSTAPSSTAPAGAGTDQICMKVTRILIDGSVEIADNAVKSIDERWSTEKVADELRATFDDMAGKVSAEADKVTDPELKAVVDRTAAELAKGAEAADPNGFLDNQFQTVSKDLDKACGA